MVIGSDGLWDMMTPMQVKKNKCSGLRYAFIEITALTDRLAASAYLFSDTYLGSLPFY